MARRNLQLPDHRGRPWVSHPLLSGKLPGVLTVFRGFANDRKPHNRPRQPDRVVKGSAPCVDTAILQLSKFLGSDHAGAEKLERGCGSLYLGSRQEIRMIKTGGTYVKFL